MNLAEIIMKDIEKELIDKQIERVKKEISDLYKDLVELQIKRQEILK